jgi:sugar phosphate isomerase/epimerase
MSDLTPAIQLYTIRDETNKNFLNATTKVREIGYEWVETAGLMGLAPEIVAKHFHSLGMKVTSCHVGIEVIQNPQETIETAIALGAKEVVVAWIPQEMRDSVSAWKITAAKLQETCERFKEKGLQLGYHNHDFEFTPIDGTTGHAILFANAPSLFAQIDTFWVAKAGGAPAEKILEFKGRLHSVHFKDLSESGEDIELGLGVLDWPTLIASSKAAGAQFAIVELDHPKLSPFESIEVSLKNLQRFLKQ